MSKWDLNHFSNSVDTEWVLKNAMKKYFSRNIYFLVLGSTFLPNGKVVIKIATRKPLKDSKKIKIENELKNQGYRVFFQDDGWFTQHEYAPKIMHETIICVKKEVTNEPT